MVRNCLFISAEITGGKDNPCPALHRNFLKVVHNERECCDNNKGKQSQNYSFKIPFF
jgi:hypothetical protein